LSKAVVVEDHTLQLFRSEHNLMSDCNVSPSSIGW